MTVSPSLVILTIVFPNGIGPPFSLLLVLMILLTSSSACKKTGDCLSVITGDVVIYVLSLYLLSSITASNAFLVA